MFVKSTIALVVLFGLSGCVGSSPAVTGVLPPHVTGIPVPLEAGAVVDPFSIFSASVNSYRPPALNPLAYNQQLQGAAQTHANNMSNEGFYSHTGTDGSNAGDRILNQGYTWVTWAENIAQGQTSAAQVFTSWQNSPDHNANLLSSEMTEFGLATAPGNYWVMVLALPKP